MVDVSKKAFFWGVGGFVIVVAVLIFFGIQYYRSATLRPGEKVLLTPSPKLKIQTYSLGGTIIRIESDAVVFDALIPYQTSGGVVMERVEKKALIDDKTIIEKAGAIGESAKTITRADLKLGMSINVFYSSSPLEVPTLKAEKITTN